MIVQVSPVARLEGEHQPLRARRRPRSPHSPKVSPPLAGSRWPCSRYATGALIGKVCQVCPGPPSIRRDTKSPGTSDNIQRTNAHAEIGRAAKFGTDEGCTMCKGRVTSRDMLHRCTDARHKRCKTKPRMDSWEPAESPAGDLLWYFCEKCVSLDLRRRRSVDQMEPSVFVLRQRSPPCYHRSGNGSKTGRGTRGGRARGVMICMRGIEDAWRFRSWSIPAPAISTSSRSRNPDIRDVLRKFCVYIYIVLVRLPMGPFESRVSNAE